MSDEAIGRLRAALSEEVVARGRGRWDQARQAWNLAVDQRAPRPWHSPAAPTTCGLQWRSPRRRASRSRLSHRARGASSLGPLNDAVLLKTARMASVEADAERRLARLEAGALAGDVVAACAEHGLAPLVGSAVDVGVVGFTLGVGWLARPQARPGLQQRPRRRGRDRRRRAGPGRRRAGGRSLWPCGGGAYGVVAARAGAAERPGAFGGSLLWPADRGEEVLRAYRDWAAAAPVDVTSDVRYQNLPPLPVVPEELRGKSLIWVDAAFGAATPGEELIAPLRALGDPVMDTFAEIAIADLGQPARGPRAAGARARRRLHAEPLPDEALTAFAELGGPSPPTGLELRHLGGALRETAPGSGALASLDAEYALFAVGAVMAPDAKQAIDAALDEVAERLGPGRRGAGSRTSPSAPGTRATASWPRRTAACAS